MRIIGNEIISTKQDDGSTATYLRVSLTSRNIGQLLDALADGRDRYGEPPSRLEDRLIDARMELEAAERARSRGYGAAR